MRWDRPNDAGLRPRWKPSYWNSGSEEDSFLGHAGPFDVWLDERAIHEGLLIAVVGPDSTKTAEGGHNFDTFRVFGGLLNRDDQEDLHIDPYHMCLIYQLCVENNIFVREDPNG
jgi:hypothetical protein